MNICILLGKILSKIELNFLYNSKKHISLVEFQISVSNPIGSNYKKQIINIKAYDEQADNMYRKFKKGDLIILEGYLDGKCVNLEYVCKVK